MTWHLAELTFLGISVEPVLPLLVLSVIPTEIIRHVLVRLRVNTMIWNWPLLVFAIYILIFSGLILALQPL